MKRRLWHALCAILFVGGSPFVQAALPNPSIDAIEVKAGIWMLRTNRPVGNSTAVALLDGDKAALLDFGMATTAQVLRDWLHRRGVREVMFAASSHHHPDHTDGLAKLSQWTKPVYITSRRQHERLLPPADKPVPWPGLESLELRTLVIDGPAQFQLGRHSVRVATTAQDKSHTDGDLLFDIDDGAVRYVGDHMFVDRYPVVDTSGGANLGGYLRTIDCLVKSSRPNAVIVPGHGLFAPEPVRAATPIQLREWREFLLESIAEVRAMRIAGMDLEAAQAKGLPTRFASLVAQPFFVRESRWIAAVYQALEANQDLDAPCSTAPGRG